MGSGAVAQTLGPLRRDGDLIPFSMTLGCDLKCHLDNITGQGLDFNFDLIPHEQRQRASAVAQLNLGKEYEIEHLLFLHARTPRRRLRW